MNEAEKFARICAVNIAPDTRFVQQGIGRRRFWQAVTIDGDQWGWLKPVASSYYLLDLRERPVCDKAGKPIRILPLSQHEKPIRRAIWAKTLVSPREQEIRYVKNQKIQAANAAVESRRRLEMMTEIEVGRVWRDIDMQLRGALESADSGNAAAAGAGIQAALDIIEQAKQNALASCARAGYGDGDLSSDGGQPS